METVIYVLILSFVAVFLFFMWLDNGKSGDSQENTIIVQDEDLTRIDPNIDLIADAYKRQLYEKLISKGATPQEALKFIS